MISNQIMLHFNGLTLAVSLALLFFIRLYKKPSAKHFLQWGAVVAFGVYTYIAFRALLPILVFVPLLWTLSDGEERSEMNPGDWVFLGSVAGMCLLFILYGLNFWGFPNQVADILSETGFFFPGLFLAALLPVLYRFWSSSFPGGRHPKMTGWVVGSLQFMLLSVAVFWHPWILTRLASLDMFHGMTFAQKMGRMGDQVQALVRFLFYGNGSISGDAFFDYPTALLAACGVAYAVGRPNWIRFWLLLLAAAGMATFIFSGDAHSGKVLAGAVVLILLGSVAAVRAWNALAQALPVLRSGFVAAMVFLAVLGVWGKMSYVRVFHHWMDRYQDGNSVSAKQARADAKAGYRVFVANSPDYPSSISTLPVSDVLLEGSGVGYLQKENVIDLAPGEKGPDVVVIFERDQAVAMNALAAAHPGSLVTSVTGGPDLVTPSTIQRLLIPFESLWAHANRKVKKRRNPVRAGPEPVFKVRWAAPDEWKRMYYTHFTMARGVVWFQDRNVDLNAPHLPMRIGTAYTARFIGGLRVEKGGKYLMTYDSDVLATVKVDGRKVVVDRPLRRKGRVTKSVTLKLEAGEHRIEIISEFRGGGLAPVVEFRPADQPNSPPMPTGAPPADSLKG